MESCPLCSINLESHNKYFLNLLKTSITLVTNVKEFGNDFEKINFSEPFDQTFESCFISGIYWTLSSLIILNQKSKLVDIIEYDELVDIFNAVIACSQNLGYSSIGFAPFYKKFYYSPTILHTLHAIQILIILSTDLSNYVTYWVSTHGKMVINFLKSQILSNGSVSRTIYHNNNIKYKQISNDSLLCGDIRDVTSLFGTIYLLEKLTGVDYSNEFVDFLPKIVEWVNNCKNDNGSYGLRPNQESHIGACFCVSAINNIIINDFIKCKKINLDTMNMSKWLTARQHINGGISGHGDKDPDVCYSYWLLATINLNSNGNNCNVDLDKLSHFIKECANLEGGFSKYPKTQTNAGYFSLLFDKDNNPDPYHSFKSLAALVLIGKQLSLLCPKHDMISIDPLTSLVHSNK